MTNSLRRRDFVLMACGALLAMCLKDFPSLWTGLPALGRDTQPCSRPHVSGATGKLFTGEKIRSYVPKSLQVNVPDVRRNATDLCCRKWAVVTTIYSPSNQVRQHAQLRGWCLVVVLDKKSPTYTAPEFASTQVVVLTVKDQLDLGKRVPFIAELPWDHFGRKNVGYAYAVMHCAEAVWDFDDDNELSAPSSTDDPKGRTHPFDELLAGGDTHLTVLSPPDSKCLTPNLLPAFAPSTEALIWPRGHPLESINDPDCYVDPGSLREVRIPTERVGVVLSLADHDPDVDAIYRLTRELPVTFTRHNSFVVVPQQNFASFNAQSTLFTASMLWSLYLPISVHGRVSDIWRAYFSQRLARLISQVVVYSSPHVEQVRNSHNYLADLNSEVPLYEQSGALLHALDRWIPPANQSATFFQAAESLWIDMYERGFVDESDVRLFQLWLDLLSASGYHI